MSLEQAYSSFNKLVIDSSAFAKELHGKYGDPKDGVPVERCSAMIRELEMANELENARMRPSWEFYRDCKRFLDIFHPFIHLFWSIYRYRREGFD